MTEKKLTPDMGEISGFGGSYEAGCIAMVEAGIAWMDEHPEADPHFHGLQGVYGLCLEDNDDAKALSEVITHAPMPHPVTGLLTTVEEFGVTGAMHQACIGHVMAYKRLGWEEYCRQRREHAEETTSKEES
jgi:hypothetical protein